MVAGTKGDNWHIDPSVRVLKEQGRCVNQSPEILLQEPQE